MTESCAGWTFVEGGYEAGPIECDLPITHNADGSWHHADFKGEFQRWSVDWQMEDAWYCAWPRVGLPTETLRRLADLITGSALVLERLPVSTAPNHVGGRINFRRYAPLEISQKTEKAINRAPRRD